MMWNIWKNKIKTVVLLACLSGFLLLLGGLIGGSQGLTVAFVLALLMNGIMYFFSDKIVLSLYGAQPLSRETHADIYEIVEELSVTMQIPLPKLWIIHTSMANAFATGRNPKHASVAVTTGILQILDLDELRGVLAHELSHIKNRDILVSTIAATIATTIGYIANMLQHAALWGAYDNRTHKRGGNPIIMIIVAILMPIAATIIQLAISRSREYLADASGAQACRDPLALASALEKLHNHIPKAHLDKDDTARANTATLFIVNPFTAESFIEFFSTHPSMKKRIALLQEMHREGRY